VKTLYESLNEEEKGIFGLARRTVVREMNAIKEHNAESCVLYLADAAAQIVALQHLALHKTTMRINDLKSGAKENEH
jgi:hypothetical protein